MMFSRLSLLANCLVLGVSAIAIERRNETEPAPETPVDPPTFNWAKLPAHTDIKFKPCYDGTGLQCAKLEVPMDWTYRSNTTEPVTLAIAASPAKVAVTDPAFKGFLLFNPGGPSAEAIDFLTGSTGAEYDTFRDTLPSLANYTIIAFDPRGVGMTTPSLDCFETMRKFKDFSALSDRPISHHSAAKVHAKWRSLWAHCELEIQSYAGTQDVARDMLEIHNKLWAAQGVDGKEHDVNFFGMSYGTALGQTFAHMYPDRVGRFLLDAVADVHEMASGKFERNMEDVDKTLNRYLELCLEAGVKQCPFAANTTTTAEIERKFVRLLAQLEDSPLPFLDRSGQPSYLSADRILAQFNSFMYAPFKNNQYAILGQLLESAITGTNEELLRQYFIELPENPAEPFSAQPYVGGSKDEVLGSIYCATNGVSVTLPQLRKTLVEYEKQSRYSWGIWGYNVAISAGWKAPSLGISKIENYGATTKNPILFAGCGFDIATPLRNARSATELWKDSGVLSVPEALGHTAFTSKSKCAHQKMSEFFQDGLVSKEEVRCKIDEQLFENLQIEEEQQED